MAESSNPTGEGPLRLKKFNSTGSQTTTDVLTTKISSADRARRAGLIATVVVAVGVLCAIAFRTSGLNPFEKPKEGPGFQAPAHTNAPE